MTQPQGRQSGALELGVQFGSAIRAVYDRISRGAIPNFPTPLGLTSHQIRDIVPAVDATITKPLVEPFLSGTDQGAGVPPGTTKAVIATASAAPLLTSPVVRQAVAPVAGGVAGVTAKTIINTAVKDKAKVESVVAPKPIAAAKEVPEARTNQVEGPKLLRTVEQTLSDPYNN